MKVGMVITVKNEQQLLRSNILYHNYLGVEQFFIFSDNSTDDTIKSIEDLPFVHIFSSVSPDFFNNRLELRKFADKASEYHVARQCLNTVFAIEEAKRKKLDWIISLDADELICLDFNNPGKGQLLDFFDCVHDKVEQIQFKALEVVQRRLEYENVFAEETLFKQQRSKIRKKICGPINKIIYDPFKNKMWKIKRFYGHRNGKCAIRLTVDAVPRSVHKFCALDGSKLRTLKAGRLLHYNYYSFNDFIKKNRNFRNRPTTKLDGSTFKTVHKFLWIDIVNHPDFSEDYLRAYYKKWIMFYDKEIRQLRKNRWGIFSKQPDILEVVSVRNAFKEFSGV